MGTSFKQTIFCNGDMISNRLYFAMQTRFQIDYILQWGLFCNGDKFQIDYILQWGQGFKQTIFCNADKVSNRLYFAMGTSFQIDYILQCGQGFR